MSFTNAPLGGQGNLLLQQVQSPNFNKATQTGWRISKDGSAYFANVELPGLATGTTVTFSSTQPSSPAVGDVWYNTSNGLEASVWNGTTWVAYQIGTGAIGSGAVTLSQINSSVNARALGGVTTTIAATAPASPLSGDLWINTTNGNQLEQYNGTTWTPLTWNAADVLAAGSVGATQLSSSITARSLGGITTTIAATAPTGAVAGDIWINTANGYQLEQYSGTAWTPISWNAANVVTAGTITGTLIAAATITGSLISAGTITAANIASNTITAAQIAAGTITASQIASGTITGTQIAAGTITASNINVSDLIANAIDGQTITGNTINGATFNGTNWTENGNGSFLYSGTPANGNLYSSFAPSSGTDGFSNPYQKGLSIYGSSSSTFLNLGVNTSVNAPSVGMTTGASFESAVASMHTFPTGSGSTQFLVTRIDGPGSSLDNLIAAIQLSSNYATASGGIVQGQLVIGSSTMASWSSKGFSATGTINAATPGSSPATAETWHTMTLSNGWTNNASFGVAKYRMVASPPNSVEIIGAIAGNSASSNTFFQLPTGYRPASAQGFSIGSTSASTTLNGRCDTSGNLQIGNLAVPSAQTFFFHTTISLDA